MVGGNERDLPLASAVAIAPTALMGGRRAQQEEGSVLPVPSTPTGNVWCGTMIRYKTEGLNDDSTISNTYQPHQAGETNLIPDENENYVTPQSIPTLHSVSPQADSTTSTQHVFTARKPSKDCPLGLLIWEVNGSIHIAFDEEGSLFSGQGQNNMGTMKLVSVNNIPVAGMTPKKVVAFLNVLEGELIILVEKEHPSVSATQVSTGSPSEMPQQADTQKRLQLFATPLSVLSIAAIILTTIFGILAGIQTSKANDLYNDNWESASLLSKVFGALGIVLAVVATPLQFFAGRHFERKQEVFGNQCLRVTSLVIYIMAILYSIILLVIGFTSPGDVTALSVFGATAVNVLAWALMFGYAETSRTTAKNE